jgi:hypothetical protein
MLHLKHVYLSGRTLENSSYFTKAVPANGIFNSAVVEFGGGYAGVFRCDDTRMSRRLHRGFSDDGVAWRIEPEPIVFGNGGTAYRYDPRVCRIDGRQRIGGAWIFPIGRHAIKRPFDGRRWDIASAFSRQSLE